MCAQKPHRGYLHNAHIRPEGEASLKGSALAINYGKRLHLLCLFRLNLRVQRFCGKVSGARYFVAIARREEN